MAPPPDTRLEMVSFFTIRLSCVVPVHVVSLGEDASSEVVLELDPLVVFVPPAESDVVLELASDVVLLLASDVVLLLGPLVELSAVTLLTELSSGNIRKYKLTSFRVTISFVNQKVMTPLDPFSSLG